MPYLIAGLALFLGVHSVSIVSHRWRDAMVARLGAAAWRAAFALAALAGLALIAYGFGRARQTPVILYVSPAWVRDTMVMFMAFVFPIAFAAYFPGLMSGVLKHPLLVAVKLWATLHLLVNGSLADVLLFGSVLAWAVADRISLKRRPQRPIRTAPPWKWNDAIAIVLGFALYVVLVAGGHQWLTGLPIPFPQRPG
ncbi:MAG TPA: NnrU family protein [Gammaproteobacteria bacterium]|nr:NnrU family protein [Gammaproteobacteria bacterium]